LWPQVFDPDTLAAFVASSAGGAMRFSVLGSVVLAACALASAPVWAQPKPQLIDSSFQLATRINNLMNAECPTADQLRGIKADVAWWNKQVADAKLQSDPALREISTSLKANLDELSKKRACTRRAETRQTATPSPVSMTWAGPANWSLATWGAPNQFTLGLDGGTGSMDTGYTGISSFPAQAGGSASSSPTSIGLSGRATWFATRYTGFSFGAYGTFYNGATAQKTFDIDPISQGLDTTITSKLDTAWGIYGGYTFKSPTLSALQAGIAGQPGAGTFNTTIYGGPAFANFTGTVTTNEAGLIRSTPFDTTVTGLRAGIEVDYPLAILGLDSERPSMSWSSGSLRDYPMRAVARAGVSVDVYPDFTVNHQAVFNSYQFNVNPDPNWRIYGGVALEFGTGGGGPMSWSAPSDIRIKRDLVQVGALDNGLALYRYKYTNGDPREYVGVMAQKVIEVMPDAVETAADGFYRVNYGKLGIRMQTWDQYQWSQTAATTQSVWRPVQGFQPVAVQRECAAPKEDFAMIVAALPETLPVMQ
jgi:hypothetical protein